MSNNLKNAVTKIRSLLKPDQTVLIYGWVPADAPVSVMVGGGHTIEVPLDRLDAIPGATREFLEKRDDEVRSKVRALVDAHGIDKVREAMK